MNNKKVLCVDDSSFMRKILITILQNIGITQIEEASNGVEAMEKYKTFQPDLILLDLVMPEKDGVGVLQEIGHEANIIVVSSMGQKDIQDRAILYGAKTFITKPFDNTKVQEVITENLNS